MAQLWLLASLHEAWGSRGGALGARVPKERLSALLLYAPQTFQNTGFDADQIERAFKTTRTPSF